MNNKAAAGFVQLPFRLVCRHILPALLIFCAFSTTLFAQNNDALRVMTFNIRYGTADDGENSWQFRKDNTAATIKNFKPDLIGLQEALQFQIEELIKEMPEYAFAGAGRDDGISAGEFSCIFYLKNRFRIDSTETFWLSDTPDAAGSKNWGNNITRICTWVQLHDKFSGADFYHFNLHLDHESQASREKSAELVVRKIIQKKLPVILTGDFNCGVENRAIKTILNSGLADTYRKLHNKEADEGTFNAFKGERSGEKIDFIFTTNEFSVIESEIIRTSYNGRFPSDHFPVTAVINLR